MNTELKEIKDAIDATNETMRSAMRTFSLIGGAEDALLDMLEGVFAKYYKSSDEKYREVALIMALELGLAWNSMINELGYSTFHKDALTKRFLKIIWEEESNED